MLFDHALNTFFECLTFFFSAFYEFGLKLTDKTWEIEKLPLRNDAVFPPLLWTGKWGKTPAPPRFTKCGQEPGLICKIPLAVAASGVAAQRITSVAWKRRDGGMVRPRAWAVFRLMTKSNVVGCSMGRSAGLAPLRILSTYAARRCPRSVRLGP